MQIVICSTRNEHSLTCLSYHVLQARENIYENTSPITRIPAGWRRRCKRLFFPVKGVCKGGTPGHHRDRTVPGPSTEGDDRRRRRGAQGEVPAQGKGKEQLPGDAVLPRGCMGVL